MFKLNYILLCIVFSISLGNASPSLDSVLQDYRKTLPAVPKRADSPEETALRATQFIFEFLEKDKKVQLEKPLSTIDLSCPLDSIFGQMFFHQYCVHGINTLYLKEFRDQRVGSIYRTFLTSLQTESPLVGTVYYAGFKSASPYDMKTGKGKVLSRDVDLQERVNYETYKYIQEALRSLGLNFNFVVLRDSFHSLTLNLEGPGERITKDSPEIHQYGRDIQKISSSTQIITLDFCDLKNAKGETFDNLIARKLDLIQKRAESIPSQDVSEVKAFLLKEYAYEPFSNKQKEARALTRAKRYTAIIGFVREHEREFLPYTFMNLFGMGTQVIPFSTHVEGHMERCKKVPFRNIMNFIGGCNSQHQLPLLYKRKDGSHTFYTIRSDYMTRLLRNGEVINIMNIEGFNTYFLEAEERLEDLLSLS